MFLCILHKVFPKLWTARCGHKTNRFFAGNDGKCFWVKRYKDKIPFCEDCYKKLTEKCVKCGKDINFGSGCCVDSEIAGKKFPHVVIGLFDYRKCIGKASALCLDCAELDYSTHCYTYSGDWEISLVDNQIVI